MAAEQLNVYSRQFQFLFERPHQQSGLRGDCLKADTSGDFANSRSEFSVKRWVLNLRRLLVMTAIEH